MGYDGTGIGVAVLDSGMDPQHPDLKGRMVYTYNYIGRNQNGSDDCGHGTHICGIIGGTGMASGGRYQGIAPGCHFVSLKVLDRMGNGNSKAVVEALHWLMDHGNINQRHEAEVKLDWDYCGDYFCKAISAKDNSVIDLLYEKISLGMCAISCYNHERYDYIIDMVKAAIDSELAICIDNSRMILVDCILNKSVLFVQIAAEIVLAEKEKMTAGDRKLIADVGYAFALIDDLCDLYEDMESGQMNLLMTHGISDDIDIEIVINSIVNQLTEKLHSIQEMTDSPFYEFVLHEIREWSMSSMELRKRMWYING